MQVLRPFASGLGRGLLAIGLSAAVTAATAAAYQPRSDDEVVERLPVRAASADDRARARALQQQLRRQSTDVTVALPAARDAIARSRRLGDPRELGRAQAWLAPWWNDPQAPPPARLLKAVILQAQHDFDPALRELEALLAMRSLPSALRAQAELTRAGVLQMRGRWDEARAGCERLAAPPLSLPHGQVCLIELDSLQGRDATSLQRLAALDRGGEGTPHAWIALLRAEMAERQDSPKTETLYKEALKGDEDVYTRAAYADWLLGRKRWADAVSVILAAAPASGDGSFDALPDALLLRLAIAEKRGNEPRAAHAVKEMQQRFEAAALRGDTTHGRERARFDLDVRGDADAALTQAKSNWAQQKEPADALLFLRAAKAAGRPSEAQPVRDFVRSNSMRDERLKGL